MIENANIVRETLVMVLQILRGMWRYRWRAVLVAWGVCLAGWLAVYSMPDIYKANSRIYVDTENAIGPLLRGIALPTDVMSEVAIVTREMLSRPNLAAVARETDLHLRAKSDAQFEGLLSGLQKNITVQGGRDNIYNIEFDDRDRQTALAVVGSLVDTFVEKSLGANRDESTSAQKFLESQIDEYDRRLVEAEERLARFKRENFQYMPEGNTGYFGRLQAARGALSATRNGLSLASRKRAELVRQLDGEEPVFGIVGQTNNSGSPSTPNSGRISSLERQLDELRLRYTDKHPRIIEILETIDLLRQEDAATAPVEPQRNLPLVSDPLDINPVYQNIRIQLSNLDVEIAELRERASEEQSTVDNLARLVDTIPQVEAELARLNRDYGVIQAKYEQLVQQLETAMIGEDADESIDDVQFRIIEPPFAASQPTGPNRPLFLTAVLVVALGAGAAVALGFSLLNPVVFDIRATTAAFDLPVLGAVSLFESPEQRKVRIAARWRFIGSIALLVVAFLGAVKMADSAPRLLQMIAGVS
ncbi:MAG: XrtA system polysaccharide chain length determinant [Woeseiaceae bacterium]